MDKIELIDWIHTTLLNSRGSIDSNKVKSPKYTKMIADVSALITEDIPFKQKVWLILNNMSETPTCICGNKIAWQEGKKKFGKFCSVKCGANDTSTKLKKEETNLAKYGSKNSLSNLEVRAKIAKTNIKKYGGVAPAASQEVRDKMVKSFLENHGVENPSHSAEVNKKRKETNIQKYGTTSPLHNKVILNKAKKTMIKKYGVEHALENSQIYNSFKNSMLLRYGVEHALHNKEFLEKSIKSIKNTYRLTDASRTQKLSRKRSSYLNIITGVRVNNLVTPLFTQEQYEGIESYSYPWKCTTCGNEFEDHLRDGNVPRCKICFPYQTPTSSAEKEIAEWLSHYTKVETQNRSLITPYEIDIYLPEYSIGIEHDGLYWHSELSGKKDSKYHSTKNKLATDAGITLIQIFEDEWIHKKELVKSILLSKIGVGITKLFARKGDIHTVTKEEEQAFLIENHIQGFVPSSIAYGLYFDNELIHICTFGKSRFNKNYQYELLRSASKRSYQVIGALSRLVTHFSKEHNNPSLISYCDKRLFTGKSYETVGFTKLVDDRPNYFYIKDYKTRLSRIRFQKHKLSKVLSEFNSELTEWENMKNNGYDRIFDAGQSVYILDKKEL